MRAGPYPHGIEFVPHTVKGPAWWLQRIMFRVRDAVKFGANRMCPICNSSLGRVRRENNDVGISGTQRRVGAPRTNVRARTRAACRFVGPHDERASPGRTAWRVLHEPAKSDFAGDGSAGDQSGAGARKRIGPIGDGRIASFKTTGRKLKSETGNWRARITNDCPLLRLQE